MRWSTGDRSNIEDYRGRSGIGGVPIGIGGFIVLALLHTARPGWQLGLLARGPGAEPVLKPFGAESRYAACVRYNARSEGQYIGSKDRLAVFYSGQLNQLINATPEQCGTAAYQPFPELESLKRPGTS